MLTCTTVPYRFPGLYEIGVAFFLFNIALFIFNVTMISLRFYYYPSTFLQSILHPTESLFIPASIISIGTILINISQYGLTPGMSGEWLFSTMLVLYWIYCGLAVLFSCGIYLVM
jgi:tellurite resistance protein TehA-like permease